MKIKAIVIYTLAAVVLALPMAGCIGTTGINR